MSRLHLICSFCTKSNREVAFMLAGPDDIFICDECVGICNKLLEEGRKHPPAMFSPFIGAMNAG